MNQIDFVGFQEDTLYAKILELRASQDAMRKALFKRQDEMKKDIEFLYEQLDTLVTAWTQMIEKQKAPLE